MQRVRTVAYFRLGQVGSCPGVLQMHGLDKYFIETFAQTRAHVSLRNVVVHGRDGTL